MKRNTNTSHWLEKGKIRVGGFYDAPSSSVEEIVSFMKKIGVNFTYALFDEGRGFKSEEGDFKYVKRLTLESHKYGIKVLGRTSLVTIHWTHILREESEALRWVMRDKDGYIPIYGGGQPTRLNGCPNNPDWIEHLKRVIDKAIECELDGLYFDNPMFSIIENKECYCKYCQDKFRKYTREVLGKEYPIPEKINWRDRLWQENIKFRYITITYAMKELNQYAKSIRDDFIISANLGAFGVARFGLDTASISEVIDFLCMEAAGRSIPRIKEDRVRHNILAYKYGLSLSESKPVVIWSYVDNNLLPSFREIQLLIAEGAFSSGIYGGGPTFGCLPVPVTEPITEYHKKEFSQQTGWQVWYRASYVRMYPEEIYNMLKQGHTLDKVIQDVSRKKSKKYIKPLKNYFDFFKKYEEYYYKEIKSLSEIGLLYSRTTRDWYYEGKDHSEFINTGQFLLEEHIPFDILTEKDITDEMLSKYKVIILPNVACMKSKQIEIINQFTNIGGCLIITGETSSYDENCSKRTKGTFYHIFEIDKEKTTKIKYGKGKILALPIDWIGRSSLIDEILSFISQELANFKNIPSKVYINLFKGKRKLFLHLLNNDLLNTANGIDVSLKCLDKPKKIYAISPDWEGIKEIKYEFIKIGKGNQIRFACPSLEIYEVVIVEFLS